MSNFQKQNPALPPRPPRRASNNSDEIPLIPLLEQSNPAKDPVAFATLRRKPVPSKETIRFSLHEDLESHSCSTDKQAGTYLPPKRFKRKPTWRNWRRPLKQTSIFLTLCSAVLTFLLLPSLFNAFPSDSYGYAPSSSYGFAPSDSFGLAPSYSHGSFPCQSSGYLNHGNWTFVGIDVHVGRMSFGQAKAADLAFNWAAGRGLQIFLAWLSYRVFTDALMRTTEMVYVPYDLFTSLALYSTKTDALWQLGRGLFGIRGWRVKAIIGWLLFSTAYLAAFPTLIDAMSGYEASLEPKLLLPNKTTMDMARSGHIELELLTFYNCTNSSKAESYNHECLKFYDETLQQNWDTYQADKSTHKSTVIYWQNSSNIICGVDQHLYNWGFSAEWLLVVGCVNSVWLFGLWILWLDADTQSQFCKKGRHMGIYRAIADIAEAMREDLGNNLCAYSEAELTAAVRKQRPIKYYVLDGKEGGAAHIGLSSRPSGRVKLSWEQEYGRYRE